MININRSRSRSRSREKNQSLEQNELGQNALIKSLREDTSYLQQKFNEKQKEQQQQQQKQQQNKVISRAGGVYIPPHKLQKMQQEILEKEDQESIEHQRIMWELLRKSINGIINKVNIINIQNVIIELLNENLLEGKGLLARAIIKAQMASPNFTHVYCALLSVINTKLPEIVNLVIKRVVLQFQRAFKRNNKIVTIATTKMMAHLINQQVLSDFIGLQLLTLLLENPTEDSVEIACDFVKECGQVMSELTPQGVNAIFERFKGILHEGQIDKRVQYSIENLFAIRKTKFSNYQGVIPELDLVEEQDQITHTINLDDEIDPQDSINIFKFNPFYKKNEYEWQQIKKEILGEDNILRLKTQKVEEIELESLNEEEESEENNKNNIQDMSEKDIVNLRRTIYLVIMNSVDFEECMHKLLKINIGEGNEDEVCNMLIECAAQERTYLRFYGLLAQRFCTIFEVYSLCFQKIFQLKYQTIHRYETNKLRNMAKFYAHLLFTESIDWQVLDVIQITQETTTSSSRIFIKILMQELAENMGLVQLSKKLNSQLLVQYTHKMFPKDHPRNTRFSINFFTSIGLGALTEEMREWLDQQNQQVQQNLEMQVQEEESSGEEEDSSQDSSNSSSSSSNSNSSNTESNSDTNSSSDNTSSHYQHDHSSSNSSPSSHSKHT